ncbi:NAD-dependent epimerase [Desulfocurvus sp.]|jgi:UDP-glucuronate 4-epimerase|uniref:NAD-dependent epimerase n=1 Tax=Desulfocurvus sp. TaxID=2871698 RepID=UPI0025BB7D0A|nr:NAD-dependent epimerase [Desulfocurvus sp.]MCK9241071.1 NAD-dependent epimerase [Desulfocurvus sp.]
MKILVTGAAGFIGYHLSKRLLGEGHTVVGLDNLNDYYSVEIKKARLAQLLDHKAFTHANINLQDAEPMEALFRKEGFTHVMNLAAQAGVRYSLINPRSYIDSNSVGFLNILEGCRHTKVEHCVFASSSSVYGLNTNMPFSVHHNVDHPISLYAATKKSNELMAHSYAYLFNLPCTGLRFFTVYGPWGRPDMALFLFTKAILEGKPINVFNHGKMRRDFTYIDDIVEGVVRVIQHTPTPNPQWSAAAPDPSSSCAPYKIYNIGNNNWVELGTFIETIEKELGMPAVRNYMDMQPGDVPATYADVDDLIADVGFKPSTSIEYGIKQFIAWYREYFKV